MKKLLIALALLVSFNLYSQQIEQLQNISTPQKDNVINQARSATQSSTLEDEVIIWYEDFENGLDGNNSSTDPSWSVDGDDGELWQKDYNGSNGAFSLNAGTLESTTADNGWMIFDCDSSNTNFNTNPTQINALVHERSGQLITPSIDLSDHDEVTLSFEHSFRWCCFSSHEIIVSVSADAGVNWTDYIVNEEYVFNEGSTTLNTQIIISSVAANQENVLIRFDWSGEEETASHYYWMIDDVRVIETPEYNSFLVNSFQRVPSFFGGTTYSNIPLTQATSTTFYFGGTIENIGANDLDSARIYGYIESANFYDQSYGSTIVSESRDTLFCNTGFEPEAEGTYVVDIYGLDDNNTSTDTASTSFMVSSYDYARDYYDFNGVQTVRRLINLEEGSQNIGNYFDIYEDATLYAIKARFDPETSSTALVKAVLHIIDTTDNPIQVFYSETPSINVGQFTDEWINFVFVNPEALDAGKTYIASIYAKYNGADSTYIETAGNNNGQSGSVFQDIDGVLLNTAGDYVPGAWYRTDLIPMVRLNFDPEATAPVGITENKGKEFKIYPNPNKGEFTLTMANEAGTYNISIQNIMGQKVYFEKMDVSKNIKKTINLPHLKAGVYNVQLEGENFKTTQKLIIE
jgi:hypothetical protein